MELSTSLPRYHPSVPKVKFIHSQVSTILLGIPYLPLAVSIEPFNMNNMKGDGPLEKDQHSNIFKENKNCDSDNTIL